jgi:diguanylate cyclase
VGTMQHSLLKLRAVYFALAIGVVSFVLSIFAFSDIRIDQQTFVNSVIISLSCAVLSWGAAYRMIDVVMASLDAAVARLAAAARGDLESPVPAQVGLALPQLPESLDSLFHQVRTNIESANSMALFDPVTALANRLNFRRETEALIEASPEGSLSALFFIDLDNFKAVNDTLGHAAGDQLLIMVANRLRSIVSSLPGNASDSAPVLGRLAGDEFTIYIPDIGSKGKASKVGGKVVDAIGQSFTIAGQTVSVGASVGIALHPGHGMTLTDLMRAADVAMYDAKSNGRGQHRFYTDALAVELADRVKLDGELQQALERREFCFLFQPQIRLSDNQVISAEALMRWNHPVDGLRAPNTFLDAAEESGLIVKLGDTAIEDIARTLSAWKQRDLNLRLSANISARQFDHGSLFERVRTIMDQNGGRFDALEIEIAEKLIMQGGDRMLRELEQFRAMGTTIVIDNFGTGYSNIAMLRELPFDRVKLDRSLTRHVDVDDMARNMLQSIVALVHSIGREAVAEGVETQAQLEILRTLGCDAAQGFAIGLPMDEASLTEWSSVPRLPVRTSKAL